MLVPILMITGGGGAALLAYIYCEWAESTWHRK